MILCKHIRGRYVFVQGVVGTLESRHNFWFMNGVCFWPSANKQGKFMPIFRENNWMGGKELKCISIAHPVRTTIFVSIPVSSHPSKKWENCKSCFQCKAPAFYPQRPLPRIFHLSSSPVTLLTQDHDSWCNLLWQPPCATQITPLSSTWVQNHSTSLILDSKLSLSQTNLILIVIYDRKLL